MSDTGPKRPPHPGEYLEQLLRGYEISQYRFAEHVGTFPGRISKVVNGTLSVTPQTAIWLEQAFGVSAEFWMHTQAMYDLRKWKRDNPIIRVERLVPPARPKNFHVPTCFDKCSCGHWGWHHADFPQGACLEEFCDCDGYENLGDVVKRVTKELGYTEEKKVWR